MKKQIGMMIMMAGLAWIPVAGAAGEDVQRREVQDLLEQRIAIAENQLSQVRAQFEAGMAPASELAAAEERLIDARLARVREDERAEQGPLVRTIPRVELPPMDLGNVSRTLREQLEGDVNFVLKEGAESLDVPALDLRGTDLLTLLNILGEIVPDLGIKVTVGSQVVPIDQVVTQTQIFSKDMGMMGFGMPESRPSAGLAEHATVIFEKTRNDPPAPRGTLTVYLGEMLEEMTLEDICTSIETAWELNPGRIEPILRFHQDTGLLIVAGEESHMESVDQVISQLTGRLDAMRADERQGLEARYRERNEELEATHETRRHALQTQFEERYEQMQNAEKKLEQDLQEVTARMTEGLERTMMELDETRAELTAAKQSHVEERSRLLEKMEDEIRAIREQAFQERRTLLEQIDDLRRSVDGERERKLDQQRQGEENAP